MSHSPIPKGTFVLVATATMAEKPYYYRMGTWEETFLSMSTHQDRVPARVEIHNLVLQETPQLHFTNAAILGNMAVVLRGQQKRERAWKAFEEAHPDVTLNLEVYYMVRPEDVENPDNWDVLVAECAAHDIDLLIDEDTPVKR